MDKKISFKNDVFFKYLLIGDDEGSIYIRHTIIEELLGFRPKFTRVLNAELLPDYLDGKKVILDVLMKMNKEIFSIWRCRYLVLLE